MAGRMPTGDKSMPHFFHGWRRKIGCVTLLMACLAMGLGVRSCNVQDCVDLPLSKHTMLQATSVNQSIIWTSYSHSHMKLTWNDFDWMSSPTIARSDRKGSSIHWVWKRFGFGVADGINWNEDIPSIFTARTIYAAPIWSIAVPLTLLSAWLLLSKPRLKKPATDSLT